MRELTLIRNMKIQIVLILALMTPVLVQTACAGKMAPTTIATNVANRGTELMNAVKLTQNAVIEAEKQGAIPTDAARKSMVVFQQIGLNGEKVATLLKTLVTLSPEGIEQQTTITQIQSALDAISTDLFAALVPIGDEATRTKIGGLAAEVSKLIATINREILNSGGGQ